MLLAHLNKLIGGVVTVVPVCPEGGLQLGGRYGRVEQTGYQGLRISGEGSGAGGEIGPVAQAAIYVGHPGGVPGVIGAGRVGAEIGLGTIEHGHRQRVEGAEKFAGKKLLIFLDKHRADGHK